jgi:hypothetical protein
MKHSTRTLPHGPVYSVRKVDTGWDVFDRHQHGVSKPMRSRSDAVAHAKELARHDGSAQIIVYDENGKVASEFFYQREERQSLAYDDSTPTVAASHAVTLREEPRAPKGRGTDR